MERAACWRSAPFSIPGFSERSSSCIMGGEFSRCYCRAESGVNPAFVHSAFILQNYSFMAVAFILVSSGQLAPDVFAEVADFAQQRFLGDTLAFCAFYKSLNQLSHVL